MTLHHTNSFIWQPFTTQHRSCQTDPTPKVPSCLQQVPPVSTLQQVLQDLTISSPTLGDPRGIQRSVYVAQLSLCGQVRAEFERAREGGAPPAWKWGELLLSCVWKEIPVGQRADCSSEEGTRIWAAPRSLSVQVSTIWEHLMRSPLKGEHTWGHK